MNRYHFDDDTRFILESQIVPFVIYQYIDKRAVALLASDGFCQMMGEDRYHTMYYLEHSLLEFNHPDDIDGITTTIKNFAENDGVFDIIYRARPGRNAEDYHIIHSKGDHITMKDGTVLAQIWYFDETENSKEVLKSISGTNIEGLLTDRVKMAKSYYDPLTELPNMTYFMSLAEAHRDSLLKNGGNPAMLSMNLNGLKSFNSKYGLEEGNRLLKAFADVLREYFTNDNCARFGEDHFYVFTDSAGIEERLEALFSDLSFLNGGRTLSVRVGIYNNQDLGTSISTACDRARIACDWNRTGFGSRFLYFNDRMRSAIENREYIISHLDEALEKEYIKVYYQTQVRLLDNKTCGAEALARWDDPNYGLLPPELFIPVLEESHLTYKLDIYIIRQVAKHFKKCYVMGIEPVPVALNLSRTDFISTDPFEELDNIVRETGLPEELFKVEITESTIMENPMVISEQIEKFHGKNYEVLMDDFGNGYSSLNTLRDFEFDEIKIDMGFLRRFDDRSKKIISSMIMMAKNLGIHTLMEGVETAEQVEFLKSLGCEKVQGFFYGKPMPFDEFTKSLTAKGITRESLEEKKFYDKVGLINVITDAPTALFFYDGKNFDLRFCNKEYSRELKIDGDGAGRFMSRLINSDSNGMNRKLRTVSDKAIRSGEEEQFTFVAGSRYYRIICKDIAGYTKGHMLHAVLYDITADENNRNRRRMDAVLRNILSVYTNVYMIDFKSDFIEVISTDRVQEKLGERVSDIEHIFGTVKQNEVIFSADRKRYERLHDTFYIQEKFRSTNKGHFSEFFRIKSAKGSWIWTEFLYISLVGSDFEKILLCIKPLETNQEKNMLIIAKHAIGPYESYLNDIEENGFGDYASSSDLLWNSLMETTDIKFFWKDKYRRFVGASKSFLDYYGFSSLDAIVGKTDEDMRWHPDDAPYKSDEETVIGKGEIIRNSAGQVMVKGMVRNILATKFPIYKDGKIEGLIGYFMDADGILSNGEEIRHALFAEPGSNLVNIRGLYLAVQGYDDNLRINNVDYTLVLIEVPSYSNVYMTHGKNVADKLDKMVLDCITDTYDKRCTFARTNNCTFAVCDKGVSGEEMEELAVKCVEKIESITEIDGKACTVMADYGLVKGSEESSMQNVISHAFLSLVEKQESRNDMPSLDEQIVQELPDSYRDMPLPYMVVRPVYKNNSDEPEDLIYVYVNKKYCEMAGLRREELIGNSYRNLFSKMDRNWLNYISRAANGEVISGRAYEESVSHWVGFIASTSTIPGCANMVFWPVDDEVNEREMLTRGQATDNAIIRIARYLNSNINYDVAIRRTLEELGKTVNPDRVYIINDEGNAVYEWCSEGIEKNVRAGEIGDAWNFANLKGALGTDNSIVLEDLNELRDKRPLVYEFLKARGIETFIMAPLYENGEIKGFVGVDNYRDDEMINTKRLVEEVSFFISNKIVNDRLLSQLNKINTIDALTGLVNRLGFRSEFGAYINDNVNSPCTMVILDIDDFKLINDVYGHWIGDYVLKNLARDMESIFMENAIVSRSGGDEFCILLKNTTAKGAEEKIKKLSRMKHEFFIKGESRLFRISIGYSEYPAQADNFTLMFQQADAALYEVKSKGKHGFLQYSPDMKLHNRTQLAFNFRNVAENMPGAILVYQAEGDERILYVSDELINLFECDDADDFMKFSGQSFRGIVHPDDIESVEEMIRGQIDHSELEVREYVEHRVITKTGLVKHVYNNGRLVKNPYYGDVFYVLLIDKDKMDKNR
ncbi:MAG: EAL domain-containing protein [Acetatifactor sp.]|nr:EAL domain-containing protein [Acetatifactor sp.]